LLGGAVIIVLAAAVILAWKRPQPFVHMQTVRALISDADGLAPIGADVRIAGLPVGKVGSVTRHGDLALLTLKLDGAPVVHRDATLALRPRLLFEGTAYLDLNPGTPTAPPLDRGVLPSSHSTPYVSLQDTFAVLDARNRADVRTLAATTGALLTPQASGRLRRIVHAAPRLIQDAQTVAGAARGPHTTELRAAVASLARLSAATASQAPALGDSLAALRQVAGAVDTDADAPLSTALATLPQAAGALRTGARAARAVVGRAQPLVRGLQPAASQLKPAFDSLTPMLQRAAPVLAQLTPALRSAATLVTGARDGAPGASGMMRTLQPTLHTLESSLLGALEARTALGDPAYLAFLGLFEGGGGASRPFGVDGQGHFMRFGLRFLTGAGLPLPPCALLSKLSPALGTALAAAGGCSS
jgi:ABC-type transporter Mla subunit MlaD